MGQKTNPNILRISNTNNWKSKYIEKKTNELYLYTTQDLEIKKFIYKFFQDNGLIVNNCKINYSHHTLNILICYKLSIDTKHLIQHINKTQNIKLKKKTQLTSELKIQKKNYSNILKHVKNYYNYENINYIKILSDQTKNRVVLSNNRKKIVKRIKKLQNYKHYLTLKSQRVVSNIAYKNFLISKLFKSISIFLRKKVHINLILKPLNKNTKFFVDKKQQHLLKKKLVQLRKYQRNEFFKEGVNLAFSCINNKNSANLISTFIATNLKKMKRHNFFLKFIKNILTIFVVKSFSSTIKGIKIKIKGRINGIPRAKHKIIKIGTVMPVLQIDSNIDYSESTSYTPNGTLGVKVWICEK